MFYCQACKKLTQPGEKPIKTIVETRDRVYTWKKGEREIAIGRGTEIVREINLCTACAGGSNAN